MVRMHAIGGLAAIMFACAAQAEPVAYAWAGFGTNISGNSKCFNYKGTIDVTVDGDSVKGLFQHEGRPARRFETTLGKDGAFKTTDSGSNSRMSVKGLIKEGESRIQLFGYCLFEGKLTRK